MTRLPCPFQGVLAFLDPLLGCASLIVELDHIAGFPAEICHDKTDTWEQFICVPFHFRYDSSGFTPTGCLILETAIPDNRPLRWATNRTGQQMVNMLVEYIIAF